MTPGKASCGCWQHSVQESGDLIGGTCDLWTLHAACLHHLFLNILELKSLSILYTYTV